MGYICFREIQGLKYQHLMHYDVLELPAGSSWLWTETIFLLTSLTASWQVVTVLVPVFVNILDLWLSRTQMWLKDLRQWKDPDNCLQTHRSRDLCDASPVPHVGLQMHVYQYMQPPNRSQLHDWFCPWYAAAGSWEIENSLWESLWHVLIWYAGSRHDYWTLHYQGDCAWEPCKERWSMYLSACCIKLVNLIFF